MHSFICITMLIILATLGVAHAEVRSCKFDGAAREQLDQQLRSNIPVVYAECRQSDGKSILILPIRTNLPVPPLVPYANGLPAVDFRSEGLLIQYLKGSCAPTSAVVEFSQTKGSVNVQLGLSSGGEGTYRLSRSLVNELLRNNFSFLFRASLEQLIESTPSTRCKTSMDMLWREPFVLPQDKK
jgi:hypothetical protein